MRNCSKSRTDFIQLHHSNSMLTSLSTLTMEIQRWSKYKRKCIHLNPYRQRLHIPFTHTVNINEQWIIYKCTVEQVWVSYFFWKFAVYLFHFLNLFLVTVKICLVVANADTSAILGYTHHLNVRLKQVYEFPHLVEPDRRPSEEDIIRSI